MPYYYYSFYPELEHVMAIRVLQMSDQIEELSKQIDKNAQDIDCVQKQLSSWRRRNFTRRNSVVNRKIEYQIFKKIEILKNACFQYSQTTKNQ